MGKFWWYQIIKNQNKCTKKVSLMLMAQLSNPLILREWFWHFAGRVEAALSKDIPYPLGPLPIGKQKLWRKGYRSFCMGCGACLWVWLTFCCWGYERIVWTTNNYWQYSRGNTTKLKDFRGVQVSHIRRQGNRHLA